MTMLGITLGNAEQQNVARVGIQMSTAAQSDNVCCSFESISRSLAQRWWVVDSLMAHLLGQCPTLVYTRG